MSKTYEITTACTVECYATIVVHAENDEDLLAQVQKPHTDVFNTCRPEWPSAHNFRIVEAVDGDGAYVIEDMEVVFNDL